MIEVRGSEAEKTRDTGVRQTGVQILTPAFTSFVTYLSPRSVEC